MHLDIKQMSFFFLDSVSHSSEFLPDCSTASCILLLSGWVPRITAHMLIPKKCSKVFKSGASIFSKRHTVDISGKKKKI